jgi:hypothetical protein
MRKANEAREQIDERELIPAPAKQPVAMRIKTRVRAGGGNDNGWAVSYNIVTDGGH